MAADEETPAEVKRQLADAVPLGRLSQPEDIADAVLFLASDRSRQITGQEIAVDGGSVL